MRLGIFGGTFDPIHYGHLLLAECCREQLKLEQVWFVPAAIPPHKQQQTLAPAAHRVAMLELALAGYEPFRVWEYEIERGGVNYTVETLAELSKRQPNDELFFLMGADSLHDLPTWREPARICELATLAIVHRSLPNSSDKPELDLAPLTNLVSSERLEAIRQSQVQMPRIDLSSRDLRARIARSESIRYRTPRAVEGYISAQQLYRA
jgi:nicotinate-nucleotide adenylyltransferase